MFEHGFPSHWSTIKKLIWLKGAGIIGGASTVWKTVTGTLIHITDALASPVKELSVAIEPQQSGSGDPSPTNIRPITGATGARIVNAQELNLMFPTSTDSISGYGITIDYLGNGKYHIHGTSTSGSYLSTIRTNSFVIPSGDGRMCDFNNSASGFLIRFMNGSSVVDTWNITKVNNYTTGYSAMAGKTTDGFAIAVGSGKTVDFTLQVIFSKNIFIDIPISWQTEAGTVYGGTLDAVNGTLTVTKATKTFDENDDWGITGSVFYINRSLTDFLIGDTYHIPYFICNKYEFQKYVSASSNAKDDGVYTNAHNTYGKRIFVRDSNYSTVDAFKASLVNSPLVVCAELAEPIEYTLSPQQISTIVGENNIWADVNGTITLTYKSDGRYSDKADTGKADFMTLTS